MTQKELIFTLPPHRVKVNLNFDDHVISFFSQGFGGE